MFYIQHGYSWTVVFTWATILLPVACTGVKSSYVRQHNAADSVSKRSRLSVASNFVSGRSSLGLSDFIDTAIYIDILFPDIVLIFKPPVSIIDKSDVTISENIEH